MFWSRAIESEGLSLVQYNWTAQFGRLDFLQDRGQRLRDQHHALGFERAPNPHGDGRKPLCNHCQRYRFSLRFIFQGTFQDVCQEKAGPLKFRLRSEEHTSELQSHLNLVCRLLLEKKKTRVSLISHLDCTSRLRTCSFFFPPRHYA